MSWFSWGAPSPPAAPPPAPPTPSMQLDTITLSRDVERVNELIRVHLEDTEKESRLRSILRTQHLENILSSMVYAATTLMTLVYIHEAHETTQTLDECIVCGNMLRSIERLRAEVVQYRLRYQVAALQNEDSKTNGDSVIAAAQSVADVSALCFRTFSAKIGAATQSAVKTKVISQVDDAITRCIGMLSATKFELRRSPNSAEP